MVGRAHNDLDRAKQLVWEDKFRLKRRDSDCLANRYDEPRKVVKQLFLTLSPGNYRKTVELVKSPGVMADIYMPTFDGITWFVKFYVDDGGRELVDIWSCNWDSVIH